VKIKSVFYSVKQIYILELKLTINMTLITDILSKIIVNKAICKNIVKIESSVYTQYFMQKAIEIQYLNC